jgi:hypothetical protein
MRRRNYEVDDKTFNAAAYKVSGWEGIAFWLMGWETEPDDDTEWTGDETRTGNVIVVMVGDDAHHVVDPTDVTPIEETEYCHTCGQIGCGHNVPEE